MAQPTLFGTASTPADNSAQAGPGPISITPPSSMQFGDRVFVLVQHRTAGAEQLTRVTTTGGQKWGLAAACDQAASGVAIWACVFNGTWAANPAFDDQGGTATALTAVMMVWRPSSTSKFVDVSVSPVRTAFSAPSTPFTVTAPAITTRKNDEVAIAVWASVDDNTYGSLTGGWTGIGTAQYRNTTGSQQSMSLAYKGMASPGTTGAASQNQNVGGAGITIMFSIYERDYPFATTPALDLYWDLENSTDGTAITSTIADSGTHLTGATGSWAVLLNAGSNNMTVENDGEHSFGGRQVSVSDTPYTDSGSTRGMRIDHTDQDGVAKYFVWTKSSATADWSIGFWYKTTLPEQGFESFTHAAMQDAGFAGFAAFNLQNFDVGWNRTYYENADSLLVQGPNIVSGTWYWVTMRFSATSNLGELAIFDEAFDQIGVTASDVLGSSPGNCEQVQIGTIGGGLTSPGAYSTYFDDLIVDFTNAVFPLGPALSQVQAPRSMHQYRMRRVL